MNPKLNPYDPPAAQTSSYVDEEDRAVSNGCAVAAVSLGAVGTLSIGYAITLFVQFSSIGQEFVPTSSPSFLIKTCLFFFGTAWFASGVLAYRMKHASSGLFFVAGLVLLAIIAITA